MIPTDPAPDIDAVAFNQGSNDPLTAFTNTIGSTVSRTFLAKTAGDYSARLTLSDPEAAFANYRVTIGAAAPSDTYTWNGSVSSNWSDGGNWNGGGAPTPGQNIVIPAGSAQSTIDIDSDQLINTLSIQRDVEFNASPNTTIGLADGEINVSAGNLAIFGSNIAFDNEVSQTGSGSVELHGEAASWTVAESGELIGFGEVSELTILPNGVLSTGDVNGSFTIGDSLDLQGTLVVDVQVYQLTEPDVSSITIGNDVTIAGTSELAFEIALEPTPHQLSAVGSKSATILQATSITGAFGTLMPDGTHIDAGIFLESTSNSGSTFDLSILHAVAGDSNGMNGFDSGDLVIVFAANQYEDGIVGNSNWVSGDWNHDGDFDSGDLVAAFTIGAYEQGAIPAIPASRKTSNIVGPLHREFSAEDNDEDDRVASNLQTTVNGDSDRIANRRRSVRLPARSVDSLFVS